MHIGCVCVCVCTHCDWRVYSLYIALLNQNLSCLGTKILDLILLDNLTST